MGHLAGISRSPVPKAAEEFDLIGTEVAFSRKCLLYVEGILDLSYKIVSGVARSYRMTEDGERQMVASTSQATSSAMRSGILTGFRLRLLRT